NVQGQIGITMQITNVGTHAIPPYKVCLFHPDLGSFFIFPSEKTGHLLPDQRREHTFPVIASGEGPKWSSRFDNDRHGKPIDHQKFEFRWIVENSEKILYRHNRSGRGIVNLIRKSKQGFEPLLGSALDWAELDSEYNNE